MPWGAKETVLGMVAWSAAFVGVGLAFIPVLRAVAGPDGFAGLSAADKSVFALLNQASAGQGLVACHRLGWLGQVDACLRPACSQQRSPPPVVDVCSASRQRHANCLCSATSRKQLPHTLLPLLALQVVETGVSLAIIRLGVAKFEPLPAELFKYDLRCAVAAALMRTQA